MTPCSASRVPRRVPLKGNIGWYLGGGYEYTKKFTVPKEYENQKVLIEFEGVYHNAEVHINGKKVAGRPYGYTNFYINTDGFFKFGEENEVKVIAHNADQPNSRWYSGTGIYRPAYLHIGGEKYIPVNGVKIRTLSYNPAQIEVAVKTSAPGEVSLEIEFEGKRVLTAIGESKAVAAQNNETKNTSALAKSLQKNIRQSFCWMFQTQSFGIRSTRAFTPAKQYSVKMK